MAHRYPIPEPSSRFWSTYQLAFLAIVAFAVVALTAGVIFRLLGAEPPTEEEIADASNGDAVQGVGDASDVSLVGRMPPEVTEGSGIAVGGDGETLWAHNDDPGPAVLFALDLDGRLRDVLEVPEVRVTDFEDIARGPCPAGHAAAACLYLADTGDNDRSRAESRIVAIEEPSEMSQGARLIGVARFSYEGGGSRDVESLAVSGERLLLVSKGQEGSADVFAVPLDAFTAQATSGDLAPAARRVGTLSIDVEDEDNRPTGAAVSPDGSILAVRTARNVYLIPVDDLSAEPVACSIGENEPQGEAIDFIDGERLLLTGETVDGEAAPLLELRCRGGSSPSEGG